MLARNLLIFYRTSMSKRVFEFSTGKSNKFWSIEVSGPSHIVNYGRIGARGQSKTKEFDSSAAASKDCEKLIKEKLKKGYIECPPRTGDFEDIFLVSERISPVKSADIDAMESAIGSLPNGYREFVRRCGGDGELFDDIHVWPPNVILDNVSRFREYMDFSRCDYVKDRKGLEECDFDDLWVIGSDGNGNKYCYFRRHEGTLFELMHGGDEIVRFDQAFLEVSRLWCDGRVRHPFPYFAPIDRKSKRFLRSFSFDTNLRQKDIAVIAADYWEQQGIDVIVVKMPPQNDDDDPDNHMIFIPSLGGKIDIGRDEKNYPGTVYGYLGCDKEHWTTMRKCNKALEETVNK